YFYASDAVIFPYKNIYQSGAVQMAMAFKKPIIVSSVGGLIETIKDNDNGLIFKNEDVGDLIEKINILYKNNELRNTIANNGYNYAKNELDWDKIAHNTYNNLYIGNGK
ncbi:MAG TPA: glycosyltransferase, partial [bacterium]|nr:glycosyltransferase [bacterium]